MNAEPPEPRPPAGPRPFTGIETFFMFLCVVMPGVSAAGFAYAGFALSYGGGSRGEMWFWITVAVFLLWVAACSFFAGWLSASKFGEEGRMPRAFKSAGAYFLMQILLVPMFGWATCASFIAIFD